MRRALWLQPDWPSLLRTTSPVPPIGKRGSWGKRFLFPSIQGDPAVSSFYLLLSIGCIRQGPPQNNLSFPFLVPIVPRTSNVYLVYSRRDRSARTNSTPSQPGGSSSAAPVPKLL